MPKLSPDSVPLLDGAVVLTKRDGTAQWQARFKVDGRWIRVTTKQKDLKAAKDAANELYLEARFRAKNNIPVQTKRFRDVAKLAIDRMEKALNAGQGKKVYRDYVQAINNYLIPFFGMHNIDRVNYAMVQEFSVWRVDKMGREPKASTLNTHNSALNRIFDEALLRGYIAKSQVPVLENKGRDAKRRPDFTLAEYQKIYRGLRKWVKEGRAGKSTHMRELLRDYVLVLANTGMRHGTEAQNLRWKHVSIIEKNGRSYVAMWVKGKTDERELIARHSCFSFLKRIHSRCPDIADIEFEQFLKTGSDKAVFRLPDGTVTKNLNQTFRAFMKESGLLKDPKTGLNRTLYSLRHMYATFAIVYEELDLHLLSRQMGTSIAMLEQHYSHLVPRLKAEQLAGKMRP